MQFKPSSRLRPHVAFGRLSTMFEEEEYAYYCSQSFLQRQRLSSSSPPISSFSAIASNRTRLLKIRCLYLHFLVFLFIPISNSITITTDVMHSHRGSSPPLPLAPAPIPLPSLPRLLPLLPPHH